MSHDELGVDYLARVEGETAISISLEGQEDIRLKIFEPPRFFEGFLVGRGHEEVGDIVSRICGICPVSHMTTAIQAIEKAMGIEPSEQVKALRRLMCLSQIAASHLVHLHTFVMPDYTGFKGASDMIEHHRATYARMLELRAGVNALTALLGGRALHPVTSLVNGFTSIPEEDDLRRLSRRLGELQIKAEEVVRMVNEFPFPDFRSDSEYVALYDADRYAINEGRIQSTGGLNIDVGEYETAFKETQVPYANAKNSRIKGKNSFMVGALARLNLKSRQLREETRDLAVEIGYPIPNHNPFHNNMAQALEIYDFMAECQETLGDMRVRPERNSYKIKAGVGGAATEAPRGLLYHRYVVSHKGTILDANIVTPTAHNFLNIEKDLRSLVGEVANLPREEIVFRCELLVRAYDPCFSCSVH